MKTNSKVRWTDDGDCRLLELKAQGKSFREIASTLMRSPAAVEQRIYILNRRVLIPREAASAGGHLHFVD
jgi:hypothetical protein